MSSPKKPHDQQLDQPRVARLARSIAWAAVAALLIPASWIPFARKNIEIGHDLWTNGLPGWSFAAIFMGAASAAFFVRTLTLAKCNKQVLVSSLLSPELRASLKASQRKAVWSYAGGCFWLLLTAASIWALVHYDPIYTSLPTT